MYGKEYGLSQAQYMYGLWSIRAYMAGYGGVKDKRVIDKALLSIPEDGRVRVLSDILDRVNAPKTDAELKTLRDKLILSVACPWLCR